MLYVVGLGNPGLEYERTRHNVGWIVLDQLAAIWGAPVFSTNKKFQAEVSRSDKRTLLKPLTFMNDSGLAVRATMAFYGDLDGQQPAEYQSLLVIHDDLDLELGHYKLQFGKGPKIHNGLNSLYDHLHTHNFWHLRVGVDTRQGDRSMPGRAYVLQRFPASEAKLVERVTETINRELTERFSS